MASIASKLARAAFATRASPLAVVRPAAAVRVSPAEGEERASSKSEVAPHASFIDRNPPIDENVFKSKEAMWAFYEHWCKFHGISRDRREMERRFKIFSNNAKGGARDEHFWSGLQAGNDQICRYDQGGEVSPTRI